MNRGGLIEAPIEPQKSASMCLMARLQTRLMTDGEKNFSEGANDLERAQYNLEDPMKQAN